MSANLWHEKIGTLAYEVTTMQVEIARNLRVEIVENENEPCHSAIKVLWKQMVQEHFAVTLW